MTAPESATAPQLSHPDIARAASWCALGWSVLPITIAITAFVSGAREPMLLVALALSALPGLFTLRLQWAKTRRAELETIGVWAVGAGLAAALTGGLSGPYGALCAAPLALGVALDPRRRVSGAAAFSVVAAAVNLWVSLTGLTPAPAPIIAPWMSLVAVGGVAGAVSAAVTFGLRRWGEDFRRAEDAATRLESLLAEQPHLIVTLDNNGRVGSAFGAAPLGLKVERLTADGLIAAADYTDRPALQAAIYRAATLGEGQAAFAPREAMDRWIELDIRRAADGRLVGVLRDATVQHGREAVLEAAKIEAEGLAAGKSRFLANMSHELRTPLNAVIGFSDIMRQKLFGPLPERYAEYAQLIHESGGHLLDLINDVLDMSKIEAERYELALEPFDARDPVSSALRLVRLQAHEAEISLRGLLPPDPLLVEADRRALKQITLNLLSNALKFTPAGGSVTVSLVTDGRNLELAVSDTGVGVAPEDLKRLGRPFEQAGAQDQKSRGTGLGLSLVRAFAELHGGQMSIESTLGEGTSVTVRLPVVLEAGSNGGARQGGLVVPLSRQA